MSFRVTITQPRTLSRLSVRVSGLSNKVLDALEAEVGNQMRLLADAVRENLAVAFRHGARLGSLVHESVRRNPRSVSGRVEVDTTEHPLLPLFERGGRTQPHLIPKGPSPLAFFWEAEGRRFKGRFAQVHHPGSRFEAYRFMAGAVEERREETIEAFRRVTGATVREEMARAAE